MLRPGNGERIETFMHDLEGLNLLIGQLVACHDDEVNIAMRVEIADCERPLQVCAHKGSAKNRLDALDQVS
jgi:hypothetical protein